MNSKLQNKLFNYSVEPPPHIWNNIDTHLNEHLSISNKLIQFEKEPPAHLWNKIESSLENQTKAARVIPFYSRYRKHLKYSGAVVSFIFLIFFLSLLVSKKTISEERPTLLTRPGIGITSVSPHNNLLISKKPPAENSRLDIFKNSSVVNRNTTFKHFIIDKGNGIVAGIRNIIPVSAVQKYNFNFNNLFDQYIIYSNEKGNAIRLSKKMYDIFACPDTDKNCMDHIQQLQEKTASSALASDFTGILDILNNLRENK